LAGVDRLWWEFVSLTTIMAIVPSRMMKDAPFSAGATLMVAVEPV
jgi:hypothetical protein